MCKIQLNKIFVLLLAFGVVLISLPKSCESCIAQVLRDHPIQVPSIDTTTRRRPPPPPKVHLPIKLRLKPNRTINEIISTERCGLAAIGPSLDPYELNRAIKLKIHNNHHRNKRIVNGDKAAVNSWPWLVRIYLREHDDSNFRCVGTLIDKRFVLTSAYCVYGLPIQHLFVSAGSSEITGGKLYGVDVIKIPNDYSGVTRQNDIAILKLKSPAMLSASAGTICLPAKHDATVIYNKNVVVAGW